MPSYNELLNQIETLKREAEAVRRQEQQAGVDEIKSLMQKHGISIQDLQLSVGKAAKKKTSVPPKYRDPASSQTWTGRGRAPRWLVDAEAQGKSRDSFLIR